MSRTMSFSRSERLRLLLRISRPPVSQGTYLLLPKQRRLLARLQEVEGMDMDAERLGEGDHLAYGGVLYRSGPDPLDLVLGEVTEAQAGQVGAGEGLVRPLRS
jgi:hypothetical protein